MANFPKAEALAILFLQKQDLGNATPRELVEKYDDALEQMKQAIAQVEKEKKPRHLATSNIQIK